MSEAKGKRGILINTPDGVYFRMYTLTGFKDYRLDHTDLSVVIDDPDSWFYDRPTDTYDGVLDHHPNTLGLNDKQPSGGS